MQGKGAGGEVQNIAADDVGGHEIRSALDALEIQRKKPGKGFDDQGFRYPRHSFQQSMASAENGEQALRDHLLLPYDHLG